MARRAAVIARSTVIITGHSPNKVAIFDGGALVDSAGDRDRGALRIDFDRRLMARFRSSVITSNGGLRAYHDLDDVLVLTTTGGEILVDALLSWC